MKTILRLIALALSLGISALAWSYDLAGEWALKIEDRNHHVIATLAVEFKDESAPSCMSGKWNRVSVISVTTEDDSFYPVSDPLSYTIDNGRLTIGRNEICDAYLWLSGDLSGEVIRGDYYSLGLGGSSPLGYFTLRRGK